MSEQQMPARIWVNPSKNQWRVGGEELEPSIVYYRADIAERMAKALEAILFEDSDKNEVDCIKDRVAAVAALSAFKDSAQDRGAS